MSFQLSNFREFASDLSERFSPYLRENWSGLENWASQTWPQKSESDSYVNVGKWERIGSALLGGYLLYRAGRKIYDNPTVITGVSGALEGTFAGGLVKRGLTGHCDAYSAAGMSSAQPEGLVDKAVDKGKDVAKAVLH